MPQIVGAFDEKSSWICLKWGSKKSINEKRREGSERKPAALFWSG
jgi:hypothetical protein